MRGVLAFCILVAACGGPTQQQLAETPSAKTPQRRSVAPAASTSDRDRELAVQQFDDMETTQRAHREAKQSNAAANKAATQPPPTTPAGTSPPPKKTGPAEQAPKQTGPAEQAPR